MRSFDAWPGWQTGVIGHVGGPRRIPWCFYQWHGGLGGGRGDQAGLPRLASVSRTGVLDRVGGRNTPKRG